MTPKELRAQRAAYMRAYMAKLRLEHPEKVTAYKKRIRGPKWRASQAAYAEKHPETQCVRCGETKPLAAFSPAINTRNGRKSACKQCRQKATAERRRSQNPDTRRAHDRDIYAATADAKRAKRRRSFVVNRPNELARGERWRSNNALAVRAYSRNYRASHQPERAALEAQRRARRTNAAEGDPVEVRLFYRFVREAEELACAYCRLLIPANQRTVDHMTPLARGGAHTLGNLCCACGCCNYRKRKQTAQEFFRALTK